MERMVTAERFDEGQLRRFAGDQYPDWNSADHWDLVRAVWQVNRARPPGESPLRMVGLRSRDIIEANCGFWVAPAGSQRYWELLGMVARNDDAGMAREVREQIMETGVKGLVFVGRSHDMTKYVFPNGAPEWFVKRIKVQSVPQWVVPPDKPFRTIMGRLLYLEYADRVFQIWPYSGLFAGIEEAMTKAQLGRAGFTVQGSPFEDVLSSPDFGDAPGVPMKLLAQGFVYLGAAGDLHANRAMPGYVTDEMFHRHRAYYEAEGEGPFANAREVDEWLQKTRWR